MKTRSRREDTRICFHEAAHLVAAKRLWIGTPYGASVEGIPEGSSGRVTSDPYGQARWARVISRGNPKLKAELREKAEKNAIASLAGQAAEHRRSRYSMERAASFLFTCAGMLKYGYPSKDLRDVVALLKVYEPNTEKREKWFGELCGRTCQYVWKWWPDILRVAGILQVKRTLDRDGIEEIYEMLGTPGLDDRRVA